MHGSTHSHHGEGTALCTDAFKAAERSAVLLPAHHTWPSSCAYLDEGQVLELALHPPIALHKLLHHRRSLLQGGVL